MSELEGTLDVSMVQPVPSRSQRWLVVELELKSKFPVLQISFLLDDIRSYLNMYNNILLFKASCMAKSKVTGGDNPPMEIGKGRGRK